MPTTMKSPITWILVADAKHAQAYIKKLAERCVPMAGNSKHRHVAETYETELVPVAGPLSAESAKQYEMGRNQTGMVFESGSSARHMSEPHVDARKEVKQHFAQEIADMLNRARVDGKFDRLVLVAPPAMLGEIESRLDEKSRGRVVTRLAKELANLDQQALARHLEALC